MNFVAIDFETANPKFSSICQVGAVVFRDGKAVSELDRLVNPKDYFHGINVGIHGITESAVADAPTFPELYDTVREMLTEQIVVSHMPFDRVALSRVIEKYSLPEIDCTWLDSAQVARRAWPQFAQRGYGLKNVARVLGIEFKHHVAKEDARVAGEVLIRAVHETSTSITDWTMRCYMPLPKPVAETQPTVMKPVRSGPLSNEVLVFTGKICLPRSDAAEFAERAGAIVANSVTRETTMVVVGDQNIAVLAGHEKSTKHRKAEQLIQSGQNIRIVGESDFLRVIAPI